MNITLLLFLPLHLHRLKLLHIFLDKQWKLDRVKLNSESGFVELDQVMKLDKVSSEFVFRLRLIYQEPIDLLEQLVTFIYLQNLVFFHHQEFERLDQGLD